MMMKRSWIGILLIVFGVAFLLDSVGVITIRNLVRHFWPILLILLGAGILMKGRKTKS